MRCFINLHSTMYLLNQYRIPAISRYQQDLHSTMYLLNLSLAIKSSAVAPYLHSTMYLLNLHCMHRVHTHCNIYIPLCIY